MTPRDWSRDFGRHVLCLSKVCGFSHSCRKFAFLTDRTSNLCNGADAHIVRGSYWAIWRFWFGKLRRFCRFFAWWHRLFRRSQWMSEWQCDCDVWVLPTVRTTTISLAISTWTTTVKWDQRKTQRFGLRLLVDACFGGLCAQNSTQTELINNYQIHKLHDRTLNMMMMIVIDTLLVGDVLQYCRLTGYMCSRYWLVRNVTDSYIY